MTRNPAPRKPSSEPETGSPRPSEPVFLVIGRLLRPHGVLGEIRMEVLTDFPERLRKGKTIYLGKQHKPAVLETLRWADRALLISIEGVSDRDEAALLRGLEVAVRSDSLPRLPEDHYYHHELIGMEVVDEHGGQLGQLAQILETGANDVYIVRREVEPELLLPAIEDVILEVDVEHRRMTVRPQDWE